MMYAPAIPLWFTKTQPVAPWPNSLNPCLEEGHYKRALYGVHGKVTELCVHCVASQAARVGLEAALLSFIPDPTGADCKA